MDEGFELYVMGFPGAFPNAFVSWLLAWYICSTVFPDGLTLT